MKNLIALMWVGAIAAGCQAGTFMAEKPDGTPLAIQFIPGLSGNPDLLIVEGEEFYGEILQEPANDPIADVIFQADAGGLVRAECVRRGIGVFDQVQCVLYEASRSSFSQVPVGTKFPRPI